MDDHFFSSSSRDRSDASDTWDFFIFFCISKVAESKAFPFLSTFGPFFFIITQASCSCSITYSSNSIYLYNTHTPFFHQQRRKITLAEIQQKDQLSTLLEPETVLAQLEHALVEIRPHCVSPLVLGSSLSKSTSREFLLGVATVMQERKLLTGMLVTMGVLAATRTELHLHVVLLLLLSPPLTQEQLILGIEGGETGLPDLLEGPSHEGIGVERPLERLKDDRGISVSELSQDVIEEGELNRHRVGMQGKHVEQEQAEFVCVALLEIQPRGHFSLLHQPLFLG